MVKPRENRVPIMLSDDELEAVDTWRFNNRVATRSDAIRRLCRLGMAVSELFPRLGKAKSQSSQAIYNLGSKIDLKKAKNSQKIQNHFIEAGDFIKENSIKNDWPEGQSIEDAYVVLFKKYKELNSIVHAIAYAHEWSRLPKTTTDALDMMGTTPEYLKSMLDDADFDE